MTIYTGQQAYNMIQKNDYPVNSIGVTRCTQGFAYWFFDGWTFDSGTTDWLIKFGFKKPISNGSIYELGDFHIQDFGPLGFFECMNHLKIDFVHRLQNLYFDLTRKEL